MKKIFIGYDYREDDAYYSCCNSLYCSSKNIEIQKLETNKLREEGLYTRPYDALSSTEFSFTRFLVPYLTEYKGWALFCDCDFIFLEDVEKLFNLRDNKYAIMCAKHDYKPKKTVKMDGAVQHQYPRKNWSSLVLWNCSHPSNRIVTPDIVNSQTGQYLHRFTWLDDSEIGELPLQWNWLVGWYKEPEDGTPKAIHYTEGGPWFENYKDCEYSEYYYKYARRNN
jgi:lipopolysaccharide biosynthesis glycosyltransferase